MKPIRVLVATTNRHKLREIREILGMPFVELVGLDEFPGAPEVIEDGLTFDANARKKASVLAEFSRLWTMADDSGLEVDALGGRPGVFSARYAGEPVNYEANNCKLLGELEGVSDRRARFRCVIALAGADGGCVSVDGSCDGEITLEPSGRNGFGYDPVFVPAGYSRTLAEMSPEQKNGLSHRGRALRRAVEEWGPMFRRKAEDLCAGIAEEFSKAVVLDNEIECLVLSARLEAEGIPHIVRSYHDSAYDGIFQQGRGWGHIEAPVKYHELIGNILQTTVRNGIDTEDLPEASGKT